MRIGHLEIEHRPRFQPQHRTPGLQRLDLGQQHVFLKIDHLEALLQAELSPS
jgi:hypothetical protein